MDVADDLRLRQHEQVVVALDVTRPVAETLAAILGFLELVLLDHRAHRTVENQDAAVQAALELLADGVVHAAQDTISRYPDKRIKMVGAPSPSAFPARCFPQC